MKTPGALGKSLHHYVLRIARLRLQQWRGYRVAGANRRLQARSGTAPAAQRLDLALVIPVWNDADRLARLLTQVRGMGIFNQIIVVDDGSDLPVAAAPDLILIRHPHPLGGGVARNAGLRAVTCDYVLFFDSDDLLTAELGLLVADLALALAPDLTPDPERAFDFCLFRYADSRVMAEPRWGQPDWDDIHWAAAGHGSGALRVAAPAALPVLVQTANYPWNKIYRTAFLRAHGIGCAATQVHQDIPLHWLGFLAAGRVLVSDRICAWHMVNPDAGRLSNRRGAERLEVFTALTPVAAAAAQAADPVWRLTLLRFVLGLTDWVSTRLDPALQPALRRAEADWLHIHILPWAAEITASDPRLAAALTARLLDPERLDPERLAPNRLAPNRLAST